MANNPTAVTNLQNWVRGGGALYASDWAYTIIESAFPGKLSYYASPDPRVGVSGAIQASVADSQFAADSGLTNLALDLDQNSWVILSPSAVTTLVEADVTAAGPQSVSAAPMVVRFSEGSGTVVYSSAHIEHGHSPQPELQELIKHTIFEL